MSTVSIQIGDEYYIKDPQSTELGKNIISESIELLDQLGYEEFTFKKLAERIGSTEASIYRYFENKLRLLVYLTSWYWAWMDYMMEYKTHHIEDKELKLKEIIRILCHVDNNSFNFNLSQLKPDALRNVVVSESDKTYLNKKVDEINNEGLFKGFKAMCHKIAVIINEINPNYKYPHAIVSTMLEASHQQAFFAQHLPSLTEIISGEDNNVELQVNHFINEIIFKVLK